MVSVSLVEIRPRSTDPYRPILGQQRFERLERDQAEIRQLLDGRRFWHVNSTATGGGVAEMLLPAIGYDLHAGIDTRWAVIGGDPEFFQLTKRIHNGLHGLDGYPGAPDREHYEHITRLNAVQLLERVEPGDVVLCHDPQTAGMIPHLLEAGVRVAWRCHIGHENVTGLVEQTWRFLEPYLRHAQLMVFTLRDYVPPFLADIPLRVDPPVIDPLSVKNGPLDDATVRAILVRSGIIAGEPGPAEPVATLPDGTLVRVERRVDVLREGDGPTMDAPLVVQVSRWDRLKDPVGVLEGFARGLGDGDEHLVLAGPDISGVTDDPEGAEVLAEVRGAWHALPAELRRRVHVLSIPMDDVHENAAIVNALQRHAAIVVQKSLYEGFGLTVTEGMWKGRPMIASAVGGIRDQIEDGVHGLLLKDPRDLDAFGDLLRQLRADPALAQRLGESARERVLDRFILPEQVAQHLQICQHFLG